MNLGKESEQIEFKKSTSELKEAMDDVCAILNKHDEGVLYFGVKPNGDVIGQEIGISTLDDIASKFKQAIKPMIYPEISEISIEDKKIIKVIFKGLEKPYSSFGRYYKRINDRSEELTPDELKSLLFATDSSNIWENNLTKYGLDDVDHEALKTFYDTAISCGRLEPLPIYDEKELLTGLGLLIDGKLTNAGYYLFSNKKPVVLKLASYVTDERINFSDIKRIENNIYNLIKIANSYIVEKIDWKVVSLKGTSRIEKPEIPVSAIREIVVNSFAHANYRAISEHEIDITPTQIEIYNPGEFPLNLTPDSFVNESQKSQPRNKVILNILFKSKDVEMFGSGFKKVYYECKKENVSFSYKIYHDGFSFIFNRKNTPPVNLKNNETELKGNDIKVYEVLKQHPSFTREMIASTIGINKRTVQRCIDKLIDNNVITRIGSKKTGHWEVIDR